jgi:predicted ATP-dependent endonuclease of OLD family
MIIKELVISNYKGISALSFKPKKINIIVGKNNTSKTSILEAIDLLFYNEKIQSRNMNSYFNIYSNEKIIDIHAETDNGLKKIEIKEAKNIEAVTSFNKELIQTFLKNLSRKTKNFSSNLENELEKVLEQTINDEFRLFLLKNTLILSNKELGERFYYGFDISDLEKISK